MACMYKDCVQGMEIWNDRDTVLSLRLVSKLSRVLDQFYHQINSNDQSPRNLIN